MLTLRRRKNGGTFSRRQRLETGSFQLPRLEDGQTRVMIDGATFASLLAGIDFTAARRGWYRRLGAKESR